ncbi:MAG: hypothetical protein NT133_11765 [Alphaproteobacteria bacterium]|nr:hypothetical protein [Alphaproteobacteria bacterium]
MNTNAPSTAPSQAEPHPAVLLGEAVAGLLVALLAPWGLWRWLPGGRALHAMLTQWGRDFAAIMARLAAGPIVPDVAVRPRGRGAKRHIAIPRTDSVRRFSRRAVRVPEVTAPRVLRPGFPPPPRALGGIARPAPRPATPPPKGRDQPDLRRCAAYSASKHATGCPAPSSGGVAWSQVLVAREQPLRKAQPRYITATQSARWWTTGRSHIVYASRR